MRTIAFATWQGLPDLTADDRLAVAPLATHGVRVVPYDWQGPMPDGLDAVVLRSCWNYHLEEAAFRAWLDALEARGVPVLNPVAVARWNLEKGYLRALAARGVRLPTTAWVARGAATPLAELLDGHGLDHVVVKPSVSGTAYRTWRTSRERAAADEAAFAGLVADAGVLVQAFVPEVLVAGEVSLVFVRGAFSHAVRKRPAAGDFRVQSDFGGSRERFSPAPRLLAQAEHVLAAVAAELGQVGEDLLYARVDGIEVDDAFVLMELEVLDPELYLAQDPAAPGRFADAIARALPH